MEILIKRKKRSEKLLPDERRRLKKYVDSFDTKADCLEAMKLSRVSLNRILASGTAKPDTLKIVREAINETA